MVEHIWCELETVWKLFSIYQCSNRFFFLSTQCATAAAVFAIDFFLSFIFLFSTLRRSPTPRRSIKALTMFLKRFHLQICRVSRWDFYPEKLFGKEGTSVREMGKFAASFCNDSSELWNRVWNDEKERMCVVWVNNSRWQSQKYCRSKSERGMNGISRTSKRHYHNNMREGKKKVCVIYIKSVMCCK